jgi:hypothetical protein
LVIEAQVFTKRDKGFLGNRTSSSGRSFLIISHITSEQGAGIEESFQTGKKPSLAWGNCAGVVGIVWGLKGIAERLRKRVEN